MTTEKRMASAYPLRAIDVGCSVGGATFELTRAFDEVRVCHLRLTYLESLLRNIMTVCFFLNGNVEWHDEHNRKSILNGVKSVCNLKDAEPSGSCSFFCEATESLVLHYFVD